jgi:hypothetical protein
VENSSEVPEFTLFHDGTALCLSAKTSLSSETAVFPLPQYGFRAVEIDFTLKPDSFTVTLRGENNSLEIRLPVSFPAERPIRLKELFRLGGPVPETPEEAGGEMADSLAPKTGAVFDEFALSYALYSENPEDFEPF